MSFGAFPNDPGLGSVGFTPPAGISGVGSYQQYSSIYNLKSSQIRKTRAALAKAFANSGLTRIYVHGDSIPAGSTVQPATQSFPIVMRKLLAAYNYTISGTGLVIACATTPTIDSRIVFGGGGWSFTFATFLAATGTAGNTITFTSDLPGTVADFWYLDTGQNFTYSLDGGAAVPVAGGSTFAVLKVSNGGLANTTHSYVLTATTGITPLAFEVRGTVGISVSNLGLPGTKASDWITNYPAGPKGYPLNFVLDAPIIPTPECVFICPSAINDANGLVPVATWVAQMTTWINAVLGSGSDVILVIPMTPAISTDVGPPVGTIPTATWNAYRQGFYNIADALNLPLVDMSDRDGLWAIANANGLMTTADGFHPDAAGYATMGRALIDSLLAT